MEVKLASTDFSKVSVTGDHEVPITTIHRLMRGGAAGRPAETRHRGSEVKALEGASAALAAGAIRAVYMEYKSP